MTDSPIRALFWDVGGVLLSNGWDTASRRRAAERFDLDWDDFEERHQLVSHAFEIGRLSLERYLEQTVFHRPRAFSPGDFRRFMLDQSRPHPEAIDLAGRLRRSGRYLMATLNNESRELNEHRLAAFELRPLFHVFLSSCYLGTRKPEDEIYRLALELTQQRPETCLFIDDRELNLECAAGFGLQTLLYEGAHQLESALQEKGVSS